MKKIFAHKAVQWIYRIIKVICTVVVLAMLLVIIVQRVSGNNLTIGGYRVFSIVSGSMLPKYQIGDILISKNIEPSFIKQGDDVVYLGEKDDFAGKIVTHQVIQVIEKDGKYSYLTKGINNKIADPIIDEDQVYGVIVYKTWFFSLLGKIMSTPLGYFGLFIIIALLVSLQIVKIIFDKDEGEESES